MAAIDIHREQRTHRDLDLSGYSNRDNFKQGLVQDYSQRLKEGNIYRQKLSRLKLSRLRPYRHRLSRLRPLRVKLSRQQLYGSEAGGGGQGEIIYSSISRKKSRSRSGLESDLVAVSNLRLNCTFPRRRFSPDLKGVFLDEEIFEKFRF